MMTKLLRAAVWATSAAFALLLLSQPVGVPAQLALAGSALVAMAAVWRLGRGAYARWTFLALGSLVVARYIFWRVTSTLPPLDQPLNFGLGLVLLMAEMYCVAILAISLIINADPMERGALEASDDGSLPTVDVFIPSYNEDEYILATTIAAAKSMDYPAEKLTVWLLDDGGTDQKIADRDPVKAAAAARRRETLRRLCTDLGARYLTRAKNEHAKAGNMNNGLKAARGEIVVVFDADHAPFRSFLRETVGYFLQDPKLFLVQTPHVFLNPDPIERNLKTFATMPSENEMFYSVTQRGLDKWDASFFCGSAALLRRAALDEVGGFSGITITEDCETAFELHAKGWHSVYVDKPLIAGLQPETFESFIGQRSRWCQGMFQILLLKNPLLKKGLRPIQKLAYLSSMTFWFFPLPRMIFTFAPLLHIFFDVKIFVSSMDEAVAYTATYMVANLMIQNYLYGRVRWPFVSELYEYVQGVYLVKAIVSVVTKPRKPSFNVTAKGLTLDENHLSGLATPFFAIFLLLAAGTATAFYRYMCEPGAELMLIVGLWTTFNLVIAAAALGVVAERREPDRHPRLTIARDGLLRIGETAHLVVVNSVSAGGCAVRFDKRARLPATLFKGSEATLSVLPLRGGKDAPALDIRLAQAVPHEDGVTFGFVFSEMTTSAYMTLADLMYGDPDAVDRFVRTRRAHKSLLAGVASFLAWAVCEPFRAFSYLPAMLHSAKPTMDIATVAAEPATALAVETPAVATADLAPATTMEIVQEPSLFVAEHDFDALAAELLAASPLDSVVDVTADWTSSLLALAAAEMRGADAPETGGTSAAAA